LLADIQAAIPLGFFLAFMIGPVFFIILETSITKGFRAAVVFDLGVIFSDVLFVLLAYFSSYQLLENLSNQPGLYVFGGTLLTAYGIITFLKKNKDKQDKSTIIPEKINYVELFVKGFLLNAINIGVLVFWLGLIIVVGPNLNGNPKRFFLFFSVLLLTYFITDVFKIILSKRLKKKLTPPIIQNLKKTVSAIIIICGIVLIIKGFLPKEQLNPSDIIKEIGQ
jgi:threonine/homoserine/homoserine lactone efflux protein|tara:strand:+ start:2816 stop:3484 length:669 start_codon:yes stop_codon:yes gene_type:complete